MDELNNYRRDLLSALERDTQELARCASSIAEDQWYVIIENTGHTAHYILYRMLALEVQEFTTQVRRILEEDQPRLDIFDVGAWMESHYSSDEPARTIIRAVSNLRLHETTNLRRISPPTWSRFARHPRWGVHTLQWWVELQHHVTRQHLCELCR